MRIVSLKIKNYRCFQNIEIDNLPAFCVLVGANGTGKSTLFDVFGFLRDALKNNVRQALQIRGGYKNERFRANFSARRTFYERDA